jgi:hypothetical protein
VWLYRGFLLWVITIKALSCRHLCTVPLYEQRAAILNRDAQQVFPLPKVALKADALSDLEGGEGAAFDLFPALSGTLTS